MRKMILVGLLAFAVALTGTAYAEVQSVKVSGDLDMKAVSHENYDLKLKQGNITGNVNSGDVPAVTDDDDANFFLSTTHVKVDADLTDNVSTSVRMVNQRTWDAEAHAAGRDSNSINIDNAYVVLKEFLYSPLTVIAGRQDLNYGTGFIVGPGLLADPQGTFASLATGGTTQAQIGQEYSAYNAYDAIRFILDFAPWTIEGVLAKINETGITTNDQNLYGFLINRKLDRWNAEVEPYWFFKDNEAETLTVNDSSATPGTQRTYETNRIHTVGLRTAATPIENLKVNLEAAHQFGKLIDTTGTQLQNRTRDAWGWTADGRYTWANVRWTPVTGVGWVYYSGEEATDENTSAIGATGATNHNDGDRFNAWDPMYRGAFHTFIQDFLTGRDAPAGLYATFDRNDTAATTNRQLLYADLGLKPLEDLTLWGRYTHAWFARAPRSGRSTTAGDEVDVKAVYAYTDDVQLAVFGGWFFPGGYYDNPGPNNRGNTLAWTTGGSASVKF